MYIIICLILISITIHLFICSVVDVPVGWGGWGYPPGRWKIIISWMSLDLCVIWSKVVKSHRKSLP